MSLSSSMSSLVSSLTTISAPPEATPFQKPDTDMVQYESLDGPSAISLMQADIEAVWEYADPELGAPACKPMDAPLLELVPITDLQNSAIELVDLPALPEMPDIVLEIPPVLADAINAASEIYGEVSNALAAAMPMIGSIQALASDIQQLPNMILGEIGAQIGAQIGGVLSEISAMSPIATALQLGAQAMQVHSAISMLANGNISSPAMLTALSSSVNLGSMLSPAIGEAASSVLSVANQAANAIAPIANAAFSVANAAQSISALANNPNGFTASAMVAATQSATDSIYSAIGSITA